LTEFDDQQPPADPPRVNLPPSRLGVAAPEAHRASDQGEADDDTFGPSESGDDWVELPPRRGGRRRSGWGSSGRLLLAVLAVIVVAVVLAATVGRSKVESLFGRNQPTPTVPAPVQVSVPEGFRLAEILYRAGQRVPRFNRAELRALIASGQVSSTLLPPGGVPPSELPPNGSPLEGLLFPDTYAVSFDQTPVAFLNEMATEMEQVTAQLGITQAAQQLGLTPYQVITVASMVQAEAGNPSEAPQIARVIYNRISRGLPLGIDATLQYLHCARVTTGDCTPLTPGELQQLKSDPSGYNTYGHTGLPPTPIGAPGADALRAAIAPATGNWLYYVRATTPNALGQPQHLFFDNDTDPAYRAAVDACHRAGLGC
jgi:cell division protein YceG involved in septum cleavage